MSNRRRFLKTSTLGTIGLAACSTASTQENKSHTEANSEADTPSVTFPIVISTWNHGIAANKAAWQILSKDGYALDAVEAGVMVTENDASNGSVGLGGRPDRDGFVTLDACIQNEKSDCGAVSFVQGFKNPIAIARKVMEDTPHVMLSGEGAEQFALEKGFSKEDLLTDDSKNAWNEWLKESNYAPVINVENHDTIGMLALDSKGRLCGACTTSGAAFKLHGRVGDSPIIGAGLFVDNEVGGAVATGLGEAVIRVAGSAMVVELMRKGASPIEAAKEIVDRIIRKHEDLTGLQVGFLAMDMKGNVGGYSVYEGFNYALLTKEKEGMVECGFDRGW